MTAARLILVIAVILTPLSCSDSSQQSAEDGGVVAPEDVPAPEPDPGPPVADPGEPVDPGEVPVDVPEPPDPGPPAEDVEVTPPDAGPQPWRSALYPDQWTPEHTDDDGRFLHDFSYAGYHHSEVAPAAAPDAQVFDVVLDFGADPTAGLDATAAAQSAIDAAAAAGGGVVLFSAGDYRLDGTLTITASHVVLRGDGAESSRLRFTQSEGLGYSSHIRFHGDQSTDLETALAADAQSRSTHISVVDADGLAPGDDIAVGWVITDEFREEHGMLATWQAFNDTWQPFFRRQVVAVDTAVTPHLVTVDVPLRYTAKTRDAATIRREPGWLSEVGVEGLGLANAVDWDAAWELNQVHALELIGVKDSWVTGVQSFEPEGGDGYHLQSGGLLIKHAKRVTVADSELGYPQHRGGGGNGYLFEVRQSSEVLFKDCTARSGRHNFIQNWGFGATGIVWLRVQSIGSATVVFKQFPDITAKALSEFHHSLATACLIDDSLIEDGWGALNRNQWSSGAGLTTTETVFWNTAGAGELKSMQYGWGYVIGTGPDISLDTGLSGASGKGTAPEDWVEGAGQGALLEPSSLFEDQLERRLSL